MTRVHFLPAALADGPAVLGEKAARLAALLLDESGLRAGDAVLRQDPAAAHANAVLPEAWTAPVLDLLASRGMAMAELGAAGRSRAVPAPIDGTHRRSVEVAADVAGARALLCCQRFGCHSRSGPDGAIYALGWGFAARAGREAMTAGRVPRIDREVCGGCGVCVTHCREGALSHDGHRGRLDPDLCTACGDCVPACFPGAIKAGPGRPLDLPELIAEHAAGALGGGERLFLGVTFVLAEDRRRLREGDKRPPTPDAGLLASLDPAALDRAACELVAERSGGDFARWSRAVVDPLAQLDHARRVGLGDGRHRLISHLA